MSLSEIDKLALSNDLIKYQSLVIVLVSLKQSSIAFTFAPPVEKRTAILELLVAVLSVNSKVGCCGSGTILFELHTDFSLLS